MMSRILVVVVLHAVSFFLVLLVTRPRPPLGHVLVGTLNHTTCNVYLPKAFETLIYENVTHIASFIVCEIYFLLVLWKCSIRSKRTCENVRECARTTLLVGK